MGGCGDAIKTEEAEHPGNTAIGRQGLVDGVSEGKGSSNYFDQD